VNLKRKRILTLRKIDPSSQKLRKHGALRKGFAKLGVGLPMNSGISSVFADFISD